MKRDPEPTNHAQRQAVIEPDHRATAALDHVAAWVRFADGKATLLAAGHAATLALLGGRLDTIAKALHASCPQSTITAVLGSLTLVSALWTLCWLIAAINPRNTVTHTGVNRFAWPVLAETTVEDLQAHVAKNGADLDAWKQEIDLAKIAKRKFGCTAKAAYGFAATLALGVALVVYTAIITA